MPPAVEGWRLDCRTAGEAPQLGFVVFHHLHFTDIDQQLSKGSDEWFWLQVSLEVADRQWHGRGGWCLGTLSVVFLHGPGQASLLTWQPQCSQLLTCQLQEQGFQLIRCLLWPSLWGPQNDFCCRGCKQVPSSPRFGGRGIWSHHLTVEWRGSKQVWGMGDTLVSIFGENVCSMEDWGAGGGAVSGKTLGLYPLLEVSFNFHQRTLAKGTLESLYTLGMKNGGSTHLARSFSTCCTPGHLTDANKVTPDSPLPSLILLLAYHAGRAEAN